MSDSLNLTAALHYADRRGWRVFPLHQICPNGLCSCMSPLGKNPRCTTEDRGGYGKHPRTANGVKDATADPKTIRGWWGGWPAANIGVATGAASGVWVLDVDGEPGIADLAKLVERNGPLPRTALARSGGGGRHYYFRWPADGLPLGNRAGVRDTNIDVRGERGYIIAPPSANAAGRYEWLLDCELADAPAWLLDWVRGTDRPPEAPPTSAPPRTGPRPGESYPDAYERAAKYLAKMPPGVTHEKGHKRTMAAARAAVWGFNLGAEVGYRLLTEEFNPRCQPPWSEKELRHKCDDADKPPFGKPRGWLLIAERGRDAGPAPGPASGSPPAPADGPGGEDRPGRPWPDPIPMRTAPDVPAFPVGLLSPWMAEWVDAQAAELQVPADLPALLALGVAAAGVARKVVVSPWPGWHWEPLNLFVFCGLTPGEKKSQTFRKALAPVMALEKAAAEAAEPVIAEAESRRRVVTKRVEHLEAKLAKATGPDIAKATCDHKAAREDLEAIVVPVRPIYRVDDDTPEKLASELCAQGGRLLVASPEARGLENIVRDDKVNADVFLKAHAGDDLRTGRIGRGRESVDRPALTCLYTPQPSVLESMAESPELRSRGFWGRWLYSLPESRVGFRDCSKPSPEVPEAVRAGYAAAVCRLWSVESAGPDEPLELQFNAAAADALTAFRVWIEPELRPGGRFHLILDWANKLAGLAVRLAGVLHCADAAGRGERPVDVIGPKVVERAVELAKGYALPHALAAFDAMGTSEAVVNARLIWRWVEKRREPAAPFTRREAHRAKPGKFPTVDDLQPVLDLLERHDLIRPTEPTGRPGPGRPASPCYEPNPKALNAEAAWA